VAVPPREAVTEVWMPATNGFRSTVATLIVPSVSTSFNVTLITTPALFRGVDAKSLLATGGRCWSP